MTKHIEMAKLEGQNVDMQEAQFTSYCFKHNDKYCYEYLSKAGGNTAADMWTPMARSTSCAALSHGPDTNPMPANPTSCNAQCTTDLGNINTNWGCCFSTLRATTPTNFQNWLNA